MKNRNKYYDNNGYIIIENVETLLDETTSREVLPYDRALEAKEKGIDMNFSDLVEIAEFLDGAYKGYSVNGCSVDFISVKTGEVNMYCEEEAD